MEPDLKRGSGGQPESQRGTINNITTHCSLFNTLQNTLTHLNALSNITNRNTTHIITEVMHNKTAHFNTALYKQTT